MAKAVATKSTSKTTNRAKALKTSDRTKPPAVAALSADEGQYLRKLQAKLDKGQTLAPQQKADHKRLEQQRVARNAYTRWQRQQSKAAPAAKAKAKPAAKAKVATKAARVSTPAVDVDDVGEIVDSLKAAIAASVKAALVKQLSLALGVDEE